MSRTVGVEEELLLVDPASWQVAAAAPAVLASTPGGPEHDGPVADVEPELHQQQLEVATEPLSGLEELRAALVRRRRDAREAAGRAGALAVATPTPVLPHDARTTPRARYRRIASEFGTIADDALVCAMHVHVEVSDPEVAVAVVDRVQPWLPVLVALSANSPFWDGRDTGYASWRSQVWARWPTGGAHEAFTSWSGYRSVAGTLQSWGAALDEGMLYYHARVARGLPTVEVRVADVCTDVDDAVLVAGLTRALVSTVAAEHLRGEPAPEGHWRADLLRAADWRAARDGATGRLVHPVRLELDDAAVVAHALVHRVRPSLEESGELALVETLLARLLADGGGAARQRALTRDGSGLERVLEDLARRTHAG